MIGGDEENLKGRFYMLKVAIGGITLLPEICGQGASRIYTAKENSGFRDSRRLHRLPPAWSLMFDTTRRLAKGYSQCKAGSKSNPSGVPRQESENKFAGNIVLWSCLNHFTIYPAKIMYHCRSK
jgi:hypothetical protein